MPTIQQLRERLPFLAFVLLLVLLLLMMGFLCLCISDLPAQAIERALLALAQVLPPTGVGLVLLFAVSTRPRALSNRPIRADGRASPFTLQRLLF